MKNKKIINIFYLFASILLFLLPIIRIILVKYRDIYLIDLAAYSAVSRALFEGNNPFPTMAKPFSAVLAPQSLSSILDKCFYFLCQVFFGAMRFKSPILP